MARPEQAPLPAPLYRSSPQEIPSAPGTGTGTRYRAMPSGRASCRGGEQTRPWGTTCRAAAPPLPPRTGPAPPPPGPAPPPSRDATLSRARHRRGRMAAAEASDSEEEDVVSYGTALQPLQEGKGPLGSSPAPPRYRRHALRREALGPGVEVGLPARFGSGGAAVRSLRPPLVESCGVWASPFSCCTDSWAAVLAREGGAGAGPGRGAAG